MSVSLTTLGALPDGGGVFSQGNHDQIATNITSQNTNNTNLSAAIDAIVAGGFSAADSITALAGGAKPGTLLTKVVNRVSTVATAADSVSLPASSAGLICVVINDAALALQIFGLGTDTVNDVGTATGIPLAGTSMAVLFCPVAGKWYSIGQWVSQFTNVLVNNIFDANGKVSLAIGATASAVNGLGVTNAATGNGTTNPVTLLPSGTDTHVGLTVTPKGASGVLTLGLSNGTADVVLGSSSGTQSVKIGNGAGISTVNLANVSVAGANVNMAGAVTGAGITDTVTISGGNAAATGIKVVNILTGTPGTSGNNRLTIGGGATAKATVNAAASTYTDWNYIATESGSNNAIAGALTDASGSNITLAAGLRVRVKLAHTLQAGANTFVFNTVSKSIKSSRNAANDIATGYAATGIIDMMYDGTQWLDMSQ